MWVSEGLGDELIGYLYREPDPATGLVPYESDTLSLVPGDYDLIVWVNPPGVTVRHRIELVSSEP